MEETPPAPVKRRGYDICKRLFDLLLGGALFVIAAPLMALLYLLILLCDGSPVWYRQTRVGQGEKTFILLKFRTMRDGAEQSHPDRPVARTGQSARVTALGRVLRRLALDELPQLWNVLRGDMSLVGPRPLPEKDLAQPGWLQSATAEECARRARWVTERHSVLPGLTGLWQISHNPEHDFNNWINADLAYVKRRSIALDIRILLLTPGAVIRGRMK
ncbi:MAG: sugar transferase [bacterium]